MAPATGTALLVLAAFVLPGFVALRYRERTYVVKADDTPFERLLSALYYSFISYLVLGLGGLVVAGTSTDDISRLWHGNAAIKEYLALAAAAVIVPILLVELARWWYGSRPRARLHFVAGLDFAHTTPSGWEHFFLRDETCFVRATLEDGRVVAGRFGGRSFAGYTAETPDLYLEERWALDDCDWFREPVKGSLGLYVRASAIVSVEFYEDGTPRQASPPWWRRLKFLLPWISMPSYPVDHADTTSSTPDPQERRDQPIAPGTESSTTPPSPS